MDTNLFNYHILTKFIFFKRYTSRHWIFFAPKGKIIEICVLQFKEMILDKVSVLIISFMYFTVFSLNVGRSFFVYSNTKKNFNIKIQNLCFSICI